MWPSTLTRYWRLLVKTRMKQLLYFSAIISLLAFGLACDPATPLPVKNTATANRTPPASTPKVDEHGHAEDNAPRISLADAKKDFDSKSAIFVDTHSKEMYDREHIAGAINVPANELEAYFNKIPKGKKFIAYCS